MQNCSERPLTRAIFLWRHPNLKSRHSDDSEYVFEKKNKGGEGEGLSPTRLLENIVQIRFM